VSAAEIAAALGGKREGRQWRCRCPAHGGHSLLLADGRNGKLLATCFGGCQWKDIFGELHALGLIGNDRLDTGGLEQEESRPHRARLETRAEIERLRRSISAARRLYRRASPASGTHAETYLRARGIAGSITPILRFLEACPHRNGHYYSAMVAPILNLDGDLIAVHKTFLSPDGSGKADLPKQEQRETCGPMRGGAVRLACHDPDRELIVAEGIESTISVMQIFGLPGWAAICAGGIEALELPRDALRILIAADNDENFVGQRAALAACSRWRYEGRQVRILIPPNIGHDFNDVLLRRGEN
jgi:putative DNA primase/helicase